MPRIQQIVSACFLVLGLTVTGFGASQPAPAMDGNSLVRVSAIAEYQAIRAGEPVSLAVRFQIEDGWHTYWKNPGDTGAEMRIVYDGPEWASLGEIHWPAPKRYVSPGDLLDFVHEGTVILLTGLTVDAEAWEAAGKPETLAFDLNCEWFVCKEICLLGEGSVSLELPVTTETAYKNRDALQAFSEARRAIPRPWEDVPEQMYRARFESGVLTLSVPRATRMTFFPAPSKELALPVDALSEAEAKGDTLRIRYRDEASTVDFLEGVLVFERGEPGAANRSTIAIEVSVPMKDETSDPPTDKS